MHTSLPPPIVIAIGAFAIPQPRNKDAIRLYRALASAPTSQLMWHPASYANDAIARADNMYWDVEAAEEGGVDLKAVRGIDELGGLSGFTFP